MNPWTIIGWSVILYATWRAFWWCWNVVVEWRAYLRDLRRHLAIEPKVDQRWRIAGEDIEIVKVDDTSIHWKDRFRLGSGGVLTREAWRAAIMGGMRFVR